MNSAEIWIPERGRIQGELADNGSFGKNDAQINKFVVVQLIILIAKITSIAISSGAPLIG